VKTKENSQIHSSPQSSSNCEPAMEAPMVWAEVFRIKMKAIGRSILVLKDRQT
jgi:hypothetical protein